MIFRLFTLFPEFFQSPLRTSLLGQACAQGRLHFKYVDLRQYGEGQYKAVDDRPFGGGAGMVMKATVLESAFQAAAESIAAENDGLSGAPQMAPYRIYMSPQGVLLTAQKARQLSEKILVENREVWILCGHYEGVDERFIEAMIDEEISVGDYVLTGGETAALVLCEAMARFVPGVVGSVSSVNEDSFESAAGDHYPGGLKYPVYTRPAQWQGREVPAVLTSGNHGAIAQWRRQQSEARTRQRRPDLLRKKER